MENPPFDVAKWLSKVVMVTRDYLEILRVTTSQAMSSVLFGERPLEVVLVPQPQTSPESVTISTSDIKATLREAGWDDIDDAPYTTLVEDLLRTMNRYHGIDVGPNTSGASAIRLSSRTLATRIIITSRYCELAACRRAALGTAHLTPKCSLRMRSAGAPPRRRRG